MKIPTLASNSVISDCKYNGQIWSVINLSNTKTTFYLDSSLPEHRRIIAAVARCEWLDIAKSIADNEAFRNARAWKIWGEEK